MQHPLVTVICLCYNHARFVDEAIRSVLSQTYPNIEVIVVDDASTDSSKAIIHKLVSEFPKLQFLSLQQNEGNCRAFNQGLAHAKGEFIVDFATDDVMLPDRIRKQVDLFSACDRSYGVVFSDSEYIDAEGRFIRRHYPYLFKKGLLKRIPEGDVYRDVVSTYFISSPTMLVRKEVFDALGGYDEALSYEDFDFWVRSSRHYRYAFLDEVTTKVRITAGSMSRGWYVRGDKQLHSTYLVCLKALALNRTAADREALITRVKYEVRQSVLSGNHREAQLFYQLLNKLGAITPIYTFMMLLSRLRIPLAWLRALYHRLRYG